MKIAALAVVAPILIVAAVVLFARWIARNTPTCTCGEPDCGGGCCARPRVAQPDYARLGLDDPESRN